MTDKFVETLVRGVIRCPGCGAPAIWLSERFGSGAFVVQISRGEANLLVREFSAIKTRHTTTFSLLERLPAAMGARIDRVRMQPDGRGRVRAEVELVRRASPVRVAAYVGDAAVIAYRLRLPVMVPQALLVHHEGVPVPSCPNEDGGLPPAPREFVEFIERVTAEEFRKR